MRTIDIVYPCNIGNRIVNVRFQEAGTAIETDAEGDIEYPVARTAYLILNKDGCADVATSLCKLLTRSEGGPMSFTLDHSDGVIASSPTVEFILDESLDVYRVPDSDDNVELGVATENGENGAQT